MDERLQVISGHSAIRPSQQQFHNAGLLTFANGL
jgi:hypothetical protein